MAFYCEECRLLFPSKKVSCPFCGGRIYFDERPDAEFLRSGYRMAPARKGSGATSQTPPAGQVSDPYERIRQAYQAEHSKEDPRERPYGSPAPEPVSEQPPAPEQDDAFFSWTPKPVSPPVVEPITAPPPPIPDPPQPQPSNWPLRRIQLFNRLAAIPGFFARHWRGLFALLLVLLALSVVAYIWSMRYVILSTLSSLLGYALVIGIMLYGIWLIIRSLFR